jgi:hypothetical protein
MSDARFEDAGGTPIRLRAECTEDLAVLSALMQDAVANVGDAAWLPRRRRFGLLVSRFRWEDRAAAERSGRGFERVRALLTIDGALRARASGIDPRDRDMVISVLALAFEAGAEGAGTLRLTLAGDGEIEIDVECLDVTLSDVARPHRAVAGSAPRHAPD